MRLQQHGLAGARRSDDEAALAFADGSEQIHDAAADVFAHGLHLDALLGIERRQVVEEDLVAGLFGRLEVDGLDLDQGEVLLAFVGRADVAADGVAGLEVELANLRGRDVDVVGAGQIVVVGGAEEAVAVGQDFQHAFGEDVAFFFALGLKDLEDQVLLAEAAGAGDFQGARDAAQFGDVFFFQFGDGHVSPAVSFEKDFATGRNSMERRYWDYLSRRGAATGASRATRGHCAAVRQRGAEGCGSKSVPDERTTLLPPPGLTPGSGAARRSSCPATVYSVYGACESPWRRAGRAGMDC